MTPRSYQTPAPFKSWALLVGANYYQDKQITPLNYCAADADALTKLLLSKSFFGYSDQRLKCLTSIDREHDQATRLAIIENLDALTRLTEEDDLLLFYFSGHGMFAGEEAYLLPSDARPGLVTDSAISLSRIKQILHKAKAKRKVVILDACHMGVYLGTKAVSDEQTPKKFLSNIKGIFEDIEGIAILASSAQEEFAEEDPLKAHGVFTYYLLEALTKREVDQNHDSYISLTEVLEYVVQKVRQEYPQRPTLRFEGSKDIVLLPVDARRENPLQRIFPMPVKDVYDFYGRREEIEKIENVLDSTSDILMVIQGDPSIGKRSLLNRIRKLLDERTEPKNRFLHFTLEPTSLRNVTDFAREIWDGLKNVLEQADITYPPEMSSSLSFSTYSNFKFQLERIIYKISGVTFVVFIEQIDNIAYDVGEIELKQIYGLMHFIIEKTGVPFLFFISSSTDLPQIYGSLPASHKVVLHPFDRADADEMIRELLKGYADISSELLDRIYGNTGGHPYFIKLLLYEAFRQQESFDHNIFSLHLLELAYKHAMKNPNVADIFSNIYRVYLTDPQRHILLLFASREGNMLTGKELSYIQVELRTAVRQLADRDYLIENRDGGYRLRVGLMGEWFKGWAQFELEAERLGVSDRFVSRNANPGDLPDEMISDGVCIDLNTGQVFVEGIAIKEKLSDLRYRALVYLAENAGRVVSRDELFQKLYKETYVLTDQSLDALKNRICKALGDTGKHPKYIETIRGRGFRMQNVTLVYIRK